jgi:hypothetical protein
MKGLEVSPSVTSTRGLCRDTVRLQSERALPGVAYRDETVEGKPRSREGVRLYGTQF